MQQIREAIDQLEPHHAVVFRLYHFEGVRYQEIAEATGLTLGTVKSRLHRARQNVRATLEADDGREENGPRVEIHNDGTLEVIGRDEPETMPVEEEETEEDDPSIPPDAAFTESEAREIRDRARHELPDLGDGRWNWYRKIGPQHGVSSSTIGSVVEARGGYSGLGPDLTETLSLEEGGGDEAA